MPKLPPQSGSRDNLSCIKDRYLPRILDRPLLAAVPSDGFYLPPPSLGSKSSREILYLGNRFNSACWPALRHSPSRRTVTIPYPASSGRDPSHPRDNFFISSIRPRSHTLAPWGFYVFYCYLLAQARYHLAPTPTRRKLLWSSR